MAFRFESMIPGITYCHQLSERSFRLHPNLAEILVRTEEETGTDAETLLSGAFQTALLKPDVLAAIIAEADFQRSCDWPDGFSAQRVQLRLRWEGREPELGVSQEMIAWICAVYGSSHPS